MLRGGHAQTRPIVALPSHRGARLAALLLSTTLVVLGCGGGGAVDPKAPGTAKSNQAPPGVPAVGEEGWCDPMPELGDSCKTELKECTIVCDYISDTCAMLVCLGGLWEYVERGEDAEQQE